MVTVSPTLMVSADTRSSDTLHFAEKWQDVEKYLDLDVANS